jgi:hypothetical protein
MAGNFSIQVEDHGLARDLFKHAAIVKREISHFAGELTDELKSTAQRLAPESGDYRRANPEWNPFGRVLDATPGNLKRAVDSYQLPGVQEGDDIQHVGLVGIDEDVAPYAEWVIKGSGPKRAGSRNGIATGSRLMVWPENPNVNLGKFGLVQRRFARGNPKQDFLFWAVEEIELDGHLSIKAEALANRVGNVPHVT